MTRERITEGLALLTLQLANGDSCAPPAGWPPHEWAYVKGIAAAAIIGLKQRLIVVREA